MNCRMSKKVAIFLPPTVPAHVAQAHAHSEDISRHNNCNVSTQQPTRTKNQGTISRSNSNRSGNFGNSNNNDKIRDGVGSGGGNSGSGGDSQTAPGAVFRLPQARCSLVGDALRADRGSKTSYAHSTHTRTGPCINKFTVCPKGHTRTNALLTVRRCCVRGSWPQNKPRTQEHGHARAI